MLLNLLGFLLATQVLVCCGFQFWVNVTLHRLALVVIAVETATFVGGISALPCKFHLHVSCFSSKISSAGEYLPLAYHRLCFFGLLRCSSSPSFPGNTMVGLYKLTGFRNYWCFSLGMVCLVPRTSLSFHLRFIPFSRDSISLHLNLLPNLVGFYSVTLFKCRNWTMLVSYPYLRGPLALCFLARSSWCTFQDTFGIFELIWDQSGKKSLEFFLSVDSFRCHLTSTM